MEKKNRVSAFPQQKDYLDRIYKSVAHVLQNQIDHPVFFVALKPKRWSLQYFAVNAPDGADAAERIRSVVDEYISGRGALDKTVSIDDLFDFCRPRLADPPERLLAGALSILVGSGEIRLGWRSERGSCEGNDMRETWVLQRRDERPLKWFQDALDFGVNTDRYSEGIDQVQPNSYELIRTLDGSAAGIKVPNYLTRSGLVAKDAEEVLYFLSEALAALKGNLGKEVRPSELTHYFVPLAGLGQWRATACWIAPPEEQDGMTSGEMVTRVLRSALNELFTQSVIGVIPTSFGYALSKEERTDRLSALCDALCSLWWADSVLLFDRHHPVYYEARNENGDLVPWPTDNQRPHSSAESERKPLWSPQEGELVVDIAELCGLQRAVVGAALGCDRAVLKLRLFEKNLAKANTLLADIQRQLREAIGAVLTFHRLEAVEREQQKLKDATRAYSTLTHELNKLFEKQFQDVPRILRSGEDLSLRERERVIFAWEVLGSVAEISYYLGKARITNEKSHRDDFFRRFRAPVLELWNSNELRSAVVLVAKHVYDLEGTKGLAENSRRIPVLEDVSEINSNLRPEEFSRCYLLFAEPIRNFLKHGPESDEAVWSVDVSDDQGLTVILSHGVPPDTYDLPESPTFQALSAFLDIHKEWDCKADLTWENCARGQRKICWSVWLGPTFFGEEKQ